MSHEDTIDLRTKISRRRLLAGMSAATVALTSPIWRPVTAHGQDANQGGKRRFFAFFSSNGIVPGRFWPAASGFDNPLVLSECLAPLQARIDDLLVLKGLHMNSTIENNLGMGDGIKPGGPHMKGPGAMLTGGSLTEGEFTGAGGPAGYADRISVDQFLAQSIGQENKFPSLEFGVRMEGQEPLRYISYSGPSMPATPVDDPWKIYERIFADVLEAQGDEDLAARLLAERRSVLDFVKDDLSAISRRVTSTDRARLEAHLEQIRGLERQLSAPRATCEPGEMPAPFDTRAMANFADVSRLQLDLMLLAHSCDLTRVSSFMFANANSWQHFPWLGIDEEHHEMSHASDDDAVQNDKLVKIHAWHSEQFKYVLERLDAVVEADGTSMLDSSLLLWGNELGAGNTHTYMNIPWVLAGGAGGIQTGRLLQYGDRPHNDLLVSVCQLMGMDDVTTFGIPGVCTGPLNGLVG